MNLLVAISILACIGIGLGLVALVRRIASPSVALPATPEWISELSVERYRPMLRLLDEEEFRFLQSQDGCTPKMAATLRRQRCKIFRGYLRSLSSDFNRVCVAIKILMMQASVDRPDLASALLRTQLTFACGMAMAHVHVTLYSVGVGTVSVSELLQPFERMRIELRSLIPAEMGAAA